MARGEGGAQRQADTLQLEGVDVTNSGIDGLVVDLSEYGWFPDILPSDEE
jgi:methylated-DNA-protein-cysteine methyltransferase related protein